MFIRVLIACLRRHQSFARTLIGASPGPQHKRDGMYIVDGTVLGGSAYELGRAERPGPRYSATLAWTAGLFGCIVQSAGGRA
jgi:hypothetical protein